MPKNNGKRRKAWRRDFAVINTECNRIHWEIIQQIQDEYVTEVDRLRLARREDPQAQSRLPGDWNFSKRVGEELDKHPHWISPEERQDRRAPKPDTHLEVAWASR